MNMLARLLCLLAIPVLSLGCVTVHPMERENLADPVMALDVDREMQRIRGHVLEVREASRGGLGLEGAGCGCN